ncbi:MAG TPA: SAM-dependent methyltransferase, partial [Allocoleopsis sp.]
DQSYDLALCSHFLFLYSEHHDLNFHQAAIAEMLRVSQEVRIFPLLTLMLERSPHLDPILQTLHNQGYQVEIQRVPYEFQKRGNEMLRICHP